MKAKIAVPVIVLLSAVAAVVVWMTQRDANAWKPNIVQDTATNPNVLINISNQHEQQSNAAFRVYIDGELLARQRLAYQEAEVYYLKLPEGETYKIRVEASDAAAEQIVAIEPGKRKMMTAHYEAYHSQGAISGRLVLNVNEAPILSTP